MDRKLKERLIGLVVLLTAAIIILPMMLGGPDEDEPRAERDGESDVPVTRLDLRERETREREPRETRRGEEEETAEAASEDEQVPVVHPLDPPEEETAESEREAETTAQPEETAAEDPPEEDPPEEADEDANGEEEPEAASDGVPEGSGWTAQVGSFGDRSNADGLMRQLRDEGFEAFLMRHERDGQVLYRVRVGLEPEREDASGIAERIQERTGHEASPVPHP